MPAAFALLCKFHFYASPLDHSASERNDPERTGYLSIVATDLIEEPFDESKVLREQLHRHPRSIHDVGDFVIKREEFRERSGRTTVVCFRLEQKTLVGHRIDISCNPSPAIEALSAIVIELMLGDIRVFANVVKQFCIEPDYSGIARESELMHHLACRPEGMPEGRSCSVMCPFCEFGLADLSHKRNAVRKETAQMLLIRHGERRISGNVHYFFINDHLFLLFGFSLQDSIPYSASQTCRISPMCPHVINMFIHSFCTGCNRLRV